MNAVITGATKGIGRAIAEKLASHGINLAICSRSQADIDEMIAVFAERHPGVKVIGKAADLSKKEDVVAFAEYVNQNYEQADVLLNNAGMFVPGNISDEEDGVLEKMMNTNLYSAYYLTRALLPNMVKYGSGHIFNMCSVASLKAYPGGGSYSISKFALLGFSKGLREELMDKNIKVTSIMPGATWSNSWQGVDLPPSRLMKASDIAELVWSALQMSPSAVVEDIVIRPQLGDL